MDLVGVRLFCCLRIENNPFSCLAIGAQATQTARNNIRIAKIIGKTLSQTLERAYQLVYSRLGSISTHSRRLWQIQRLDEVSGSLRLPEQPYVYASCPQYVQFLLWFLGGGCKLDSAANVHINDVIDNNCRMILQLEPAKPWISQSLKPHISMYQNRNDQYKPLSSQPLTTRARSVLSTPELAAASTTSIYPLAS